MRDDLFRRLPPATALLLLAALMLDQTHAHALPRPISSFPLPTATLPYRVLDVAPWPPLPTVGAVSPAEFHELLRRQDTNTVCGFIGDKPATCSAGSHCVVDQEHNAIGCCPNGQPTCTTGIFTGCVDFNSGAQNVVNPYVYTCQGSDVCYRNVFNGGFTQFGCGTASDLATTVRNTASGITLSLSSGQFSLTRTASTLSSPTSIGSRPTTSTSRSTTSSSTTSSRSSSTSSSSSTRSSTSTSSTTSSQPTQSNTAAAAASSGGGSSVDRIGAIVGGTISGVAVLIAVVAVGIYLWRKKASNVRKGPGVGGGTQYISPMSGNAGFQRLHETNAGFETGLPPGAMANAAAAGGGGPMMQQYPPQQWGGGMGGMGGVGAAGAGTGAALGTPTMGYMGNAGTVRYVESNAGVGLAPNVGSVENIALPGAAGAGLATGAAAGMGAAVGTGMATGAMMAGGAGPGAGAGAYPASGAAGPATGSAAGSGSMAAQTPDYLGGMVSLGSAPGGSDGLSGVARPDSNVIPTPPTQGYHYPGQFPAAYAGATAAAAVGGAASGGLQRGMSNTSGSSFYTLPPATATTTGGGGGGVGPTLSMRGGGSVHGVGRGSGVFAAAAVAGGATTTSSSSIQQTPPPPMPSMPMPIPMMPPPPRAVATSREFDDFSRGFNDALERIGEDEPLTSSGHMRSSSIGASRSGGPGGGGDPPRPKSSGGGSTTETPRPLWHQNRAQSRNLMWM